jgi:hypothetical protein
MNLSDLENLLEKEAKRAQFTLDLLEQVRMARSLTQAARETTLELDKLKEEEKRLLAAVEANKKKVAESTKAMTETLKNATIVHNEKMDVLEQQEAEAKSRIAALLQDAKDLKSIVDAQHAERVSDYQSQENELRNRVASLQQRLSELKAEATR